MLYQDALTGALHEAPDGQLYEPDFAEYPYNLGEPVFDGLGNPVGFLPFLPKIASLASSFLPKIGGLVGNLFGGGAPPSPLAALQSAIPGMPGPMGPMMPPPPPMYGQPPGWIPRPNPYTGVPGRRMYMRCAVWRGPGGLVPMIAAQTPAAAAAIPAAAAAAAQTAAAMGYRRRRRRR
jgi:hypothetical protein